MIFGEELACCSPDFCNSDVEYRYPINGIGTQIQHWNLVSVLASEYRYQLSENSFWDSLKFDSLHLGPYICHVSFPEFG
ncbi:hypothetical protein GQ457_01G019480 [Hibiscus cannabinus]